MIIFKESSKEVWLLVLVVLMAVAANLPEDFASAYSIEKKYLLMALTAIIAVSILRYLRFTLLLMTVILAAGANLPAEMADRFNIDPSIMFFTLVVMVVVAAVNRFLKVIPENNPKRLQGSVHGARALIKAISTGNVKNVQRLIQSGVNVNVTTLSGKTPLMLAAFTGYADIVQLLIGAGADIHARDRDGNTATSIAERKGFSRIKALLTTQG
ncbi:MAG: ankyrin repeat domain-containing protein [Arenicellales bacterium]